MNYLELLALKVTQPLGDFYIASVKARDLLEVTFSEQLQYTDENGRLHGSQRKIDSKRLHEIGRYIDSVEMSFPNSIVLAANYTEEGYVLDDERIRWDVIEINKSLYKIIIPTNTKLAAIIDGQHRLKGFEKPYLEKGERLEVEIPCSIFFDLPNSYQAFLFATINGNQKRVDKSLALEQFGFNVEEEPQQSWNPEKLAVYFTRRLNFKDSPISGHIKIAPKISSDLERKIFESQRQWSISTATVVDGILGLISSKPKRDRVEMAQENIWGKRSRNMVEKFKNDKSPLRQYYLNKEDDFIYSIIVNFLEASKETVWKQFDAKSYIFKTVGVQALFDFLKKILSTKIVTTKEDFISYLKPALHYDFSKSTVQASGIGRKDIRNTLLYAAGLLNASELKESDLQKIGSFENG